MRLQLGLCAAAGKGSKPQQSGLAVSGTEGPSESGQLMSLRLSPEDSIPRQIEALDGA
jgi:hypothetical protein